MKKFVVILVFVLAFLGFALHKLPADQVLSRITLPKTIQMAGISGTIWQGQLQQVAYQGTLINNVTWQFNWLSLLTFSPSIDTTFGGRMHSGPEGKATVGGFITQKITISNAQVAVPANDIVSDLPMPVPMTAGGIIQLTLPSFVMGSPVCSNAQGKVQWQNALVTAFQEQIGLDSVTADIGCEQGLLALTINSNNVLGLEFKALIDGTGKVSGTGLLTPGSQFPQKLKPALPFIGRADSQGRYPLKI